MASNKKTVENRNTLRLICGILLIALVVVGFKYAVLRSTWRNYSGEAQKSILMWAGKNAEEQAKVVGMGGMFKMNGREMYRSPKDLQNYIATIGIGLKHDIVVVDRNKTILADIVATNVSKKYTEDKGDEVQKTISDGITRSFVEKSVDYPNGINQTVVALKDTAGQVMGAIIFSSDTI